MPREQSVPRRAPQNVGDRRLPPAPANPLSGRNSNSSAAVAQSQHHTPASARNNNNNNGGGSAARGAQQQPPESNKRAAAAAAASATPRRDLHGEALEYTLPSGARYVGDFEHGMMHGHGRYEYSNGDTYEGDFRQDKIHGHGTYEYAHGDTYTGEWQNGHRTGKGAYTFQHNGSVLSGWWRADQPHGFGKLLVPSEQDFPRYEGNWEDSMRHGLGVQRHANGSAYDGQWDRGREDGMGVLTGADGSIYCGEWRAGQRDGRGLIIEHGVKYLVEFNFDYEVARDPLPKDAKSVPAAFKPVYDFFIKWWRKTRGATTAAGARGQPAQDGDDGVSALVVDREVYENVLARNRELERELATTLEGGGGAGGEDEDAAMAASNNPDDLKRSIYRLIEQRDAERRRARHAEQKIVRLRMNGVDVDSALDMATDPASVAAASAAASARPRGSPAAAGGAAAAAAAAAAEAAALREQVQQMEAEVKLKDAKLKEAEKRNITAQSSIEELQGELNAAKMRDAGGGSTTPMGASSARGLGAGGHRASVAAVAPAPKPQDQDEINRLNFELARLRRELDEAAKGRDEAEKKYGKEKEKHKRAGKERDVAKANLAVREQEAALNERLFRLIGAGQAIMLGVLTPGGALNVSEDGKSLTCATPEVSFELDAVYRAEQTQELEDEWVNAVTGVRNGYSCALIMLGSDEAARGALVSNVLPGVVRQLFAATAQMQSMYDVTITMSFVEVARHNLTDLLSGAGGAAPAEITIMKDARGTIAFEGAARQPVSSPDEAVKTWSRVADELARGKRVSNRMLVFWVDAIDKASKAAFHGKLLVADICATTASNAPIVATESCNLLCNALNEFASTDAYQHRGEPLLMALNDAIGGPTRTIFMFGAGAERTLSGSTQSMLQTLSDCREKIANFPLQHFETPHALALQRYVAEKAPRELPPRFFPLAPQAAGQ